MTVPFVTSRALDLRGIRHGFFGREGGVSTGDFAALNVSISVGDEPGPVLQNRQAAAAALGFDRANLLLLKQVHSATVEVKVRVPPTDIAVEADAMVTKHRGLLLGILTADCTPILLADPEAGVVGAAHAGWKGAVEGIVANTVERMCQLGARPARIRAAIGPTISQPSYEVGPDFAASLLARHPSAAHRIAVPAPGGREHFDLPGFVTDQLVAAGIGLIDDLALCTYALPERYFSHRRATHERTTTGRQIALIGLA